MKRIITAKGLTKSYDGIHNILSDVNIEIEEGSKNLIIGESGCGKTTLLSMLEGIEQPDSGVLTIKDYDVYGMKSKERTKFRGENLGIVFQNYQLIQELKAIDNIKLPAVINRKKIDEKYLKWLISALNIKHCIKRYPDELSGGEQQRIAIARAMILRPAILFADEPTGNLDDENTEYVMDLIELLNQKLKVTIVMVSHDTTMIKRMDTVFEIKNKKLKRTDYYA